MNDIENQLPQIFEAAAAGIEPPVEEIIAAGTALGRRRRLRRATGMAFASVGVVGLTAGVVLGVQRFGIGTGAGGRGPVNAAGAAHSTGLPSGTSPGTARPPTETPATQTPTAGSSPQGTAASSALNSASTTSATPTSSAASGHEAATGLLSKLLSGYGLSPVGTSNAPIGVADLVYDDGRGPSEIIASVVQYTAQMATENDYTCVGFISTDATARQPGAPQPSCTQQSAANGDAEYVVVTADDGSGFYDYEVNLFTPGGVVVALDVGNGVPRGATVEVTRAVPPLTLAQIEKIAADPAWLKYRDPQN